MQLSNTYHFDLIGKSKPKILEISNFNFSIKGKEKISIKHNQVSNTNYLKNQNYYAILQCFNQMTKNFSSEVEKVKMGECILEKLKQILYYMMNLSNEDRQDISRNLQNNLKSILFF